VLTKHKNKEILHCRHFRSPSTIVDKLLVHSKKIQ